MLAGAFDAQGDPDLEAQSPVSLPDLHIHPKGSRAQDPSRLHRGVQRRCGYTGKVLISPVRSREGGQHPRRQENRGRQAEERAMQREKRKGARRAKLNTMIVPSHDGSAIGPNNGSRGGGCLKWRDASLGCGAITEAQPGCQIEPPDVIEIRQFP
ncbi:hypothetical protein CVT26_012446 [Gymnopilus dilepis]|uniref:Uncharacterized protein n=1 Tax=Gymnopilus dilepis TaxID=231916 RepID=A0A409YW77_9AGAR|nr:hypothetical protein CVT26_012446 [Gymnopilus dilepis]